MKKVWINTSTNKIYSTKEKAEEKRRPDQSIQQRNVDEPEPNEITLYIIQGSKLPKITIVQLTDSTSADEMKSAGKHFADYINENMPIHQIDEIKYQLGFI